MKNTAHCILIVLVFLSTIYSCKTNSPSSATSIPNPLYLNTILDTFVNKGHYPFIYARIEALDGEVMYEHSAVNPHLLPNQIIDGNSWIRIWSMSKLVTISIAMDLVEEGKIKLDDPVIKYIPEFKDLKVAVTKDGKNLSSLEWGQREKVCPVKLIPNDSVMTIEHLLNHEAGFYYATTQFECLDSLVASEDLCSAENTDDFIKRIAKLPLVQHSGTDYFYGINTTILGFVAERATGKSLPQLVKERITQPMNISGLQYGLKNFKNLPPTVSGKDTILRKAQPGELDIFGPTVPSYDPDRQLYLGGEGMVATADGYADFIRMILNGGKLNNHRFLEEETIKQIHSPHTQLDNPYGYNGYNLWVTSDSMRIKRTGDAGLWIGGGYEGTHFWIDPKRKFVGIIMTQISFAQPAAYTMTDQFRGALYKQLFESEGEVY